MGKILTISIAAYNVEPYIRQALDSITRSKYIDEIEVFVIDDGSPDGVLDIVRNHYQTKYPDSIYPVHKENGGYGTTVNYAIENATGLFFKLLDGDDWFNSDNLDLLIEFLKANNPDWTLSPMQKMPSSGVKPVIANGWFKYAGEVLDVIDIKEELYGGIWESTFKTRIVKEHARKLPEHCLYTDRLFVATIIPFVKNVGFTDNVVYCYRVGRDGQSVSLDARRNHYKEYLHTTELIKEYYYSINGDGLPEKLRNKLLSYYKFDIFNLLLLPVSKATCELIICLEEETKRNAKSFYDYAAVESKKIRLLRGSLYLAYWPIAIMLDNNW